MREGEGRRGVGEPEGRPSRAWGERTARELEELLERDPVVVLPVSAVEQHGPHLPLSTDVEIGKGILHAALDRLPGDSPVLTLPAQVVGASLEHADVAGTLSLSPATLEAALVETGASLARHGVRRLVVLNSHGGNKAVVDTAALRLREAHGLLVVKAHWFRFPRPADVAIPEDEWTHGLHGGAVETAMMLHLRPDLVRPEGVRDFPSLGRALEGTLRYVGPEGVAPFAWTARDLNEEGVVGDARLATPAMGRRLVEHYGTVLRHVIEDALRFPLALLATGDG